MAIDLNGALHRLDRYQAMNGELEGSSENIILACIDKILLEKNGFRYNSEVRLENAFGGLCLFASKHLSLKVQRAINKIETVLQGGFFDPVAESVWKVLGNKADSLGLRGQKRTDYIIAGKHYYLSLALCVQEADVCIERPTAFISEGLDLYVQVSKFLVDKSQEKHREILAETLFQYLSSKCDFSMDQEEPEPESRKVLEEQSVVKDRLFLHQRFIKDRIQMSDISEKELERRLDLAREQEEIIRTRIDCYGYDWEYYVVKGFFSKEERVGESFAFGNYSIIDNQPLTEEEKRELWSEIQDIEKWEEVFTSFEPTANRDPYEIRKVILNLIEEGRQRQHPIREYVSFGFNWYRNLIFLAMYKDFSELETCHFVECGMKQYEKIYSEGSKELVTRILQEKGDLIRMLNEGGD